jgi:hypothetical protein
MITPTPEPIPGAPPYVVWLVGLIFIVLAALIVTSIIAIAVWLYQEACERGKPGWLWLILGLVGGWLTALVWLSMRDNYSDPAVGRGLHTGLTAGPHGTDRR